MPRRKTILITGCGGAGIGSALATEFQARGHRVFATDKSEEQLPSLAALGIETFALDVTSTASIKAAVVYVAKATSGEGHDNGSLDVLVNNAGVLQLMPFADTDVEDARRIMEVNFLGVYAVTKAFLPLLLAAANDGTGDAVVANIGSVNSVLNPLFLGAYNASKAAVEALGCTIRRELAPLGVRVLTVKTGSVRTGLFSNAPPTELPDDSLYLHAREMIEQRKMLESAQFMEAEVYARNVVDELLKPRPKHVIWQGGLTTIAWILSWFGWEGMLDSTLIKAHGLNQIGTKRAK